MDSKIKKVEISIHDACAQIIRKQDNYSQKFVAKAFAFRADLESLAQQRHKYSQQAIDLLNQIEEKDDEHEYLVELCNGILKCYDRTKTLNEKEIWKLRS